MGRIRICLDNEKVKKWTLEKTLFHSINLSTFSTDIALQGCLSCPKDRKGSQEIFDEYFRVCLSGGGELEAKLLGASLQTYPVRFLQSPKMNSMNFFPEFLLISRLIASVVQLTLIPHNAGHTWR